RLPEALAVPFSLVSRQLCLPAILTYADCVLSNWRLKDPAGNMDLIFNFPGVESCRGFLLVSVIVEKSAASGLRAMLATRRAVETCDEASVLNGLAEITASLKRMRDDFKLMHDGLVYEGVSEEPVFLSGCSAAQSSAIQCFDAFLGVQHEEPSGKLHESQSAFLRRIRLHMPPDHRRLIESLSAGARLRDLVISRPTLHLHRAYNRCVSALEDLRNFHLCAVAKFITVPSGQARAAAAATAGRCPLGGGLGLDSTGTGGSNPMIFLKSQQGHMVIYRPILLVAQLQQQGHMVIYRPILLAAQ
ncbi:hypothetical protein CRUP_011847, partial [Coryphaenoides rupestris]